MRVRSHIFLLFVMLLLAAVFHDGYAQPGFQVDIKKDKPFESRKLKSEKTGEGQLKTPKRLFQNLTTRYNYYFNANNKFNEILARAKEQHKDDFSQLLPFYNYSLDVTAADSLQLDSVIYKCKTGIVNHDLRSEWSDELYLLWAASWHMRKKLDSASMMLQFINYAYAPQEDYGFYSYIGTHKEGAQELSITTKEDKKFLHSNNFSRNDAFIWQVKTRIEMGDLGTAGNLIATLKRDPAFPKRLTHALAEAESYWYYKQSRWDSSAAYLIKALDGAETKNEKARWEYLIAQMLEHSGKPGEASTYYAKSISTTNDPILEVYGRLNLVRLGKDGVENSIDKNVAELLKMAKRDKYEDYRDIIYYMAAQMEMERNNIARAQELLMEGAKYNNGNNASRNKAFLQIADVSYSQKKYVQAASFYDSVQVNDLTDAEIQRLRERRTGLQPVVLNSKIISRQDSLQKIAAMPQEQRDEYVKALVKKLRKQQGLQDESAPTTGGTGMAASQGADMFSNSSKGEWYFYNANSRTQGSAEFKQVWGNRPNVDNWRRFTAVSQQMNRAAMNNRANPAMAFNNASPVVDLTFEGLTAKLPLTPESMKISNDSVKNALFNLGTAYLNEIEDYPSAIETFEELRRRFPNADRMDEVLFNLYYAYTKAGNTSQAAQIKKLLLDRFPASRFASILATGKDPQANTNSSAEATKAYENVYNLFIEGHFAEAVTAKKLADSTYKTTFWQPQLLYIEAVYYIKQRQDSVAKTSLQQIITQNTNPALTDKAQTLLNVLKRRQQIEAELNAYQIQNKTEAVDTPVAEQPAEVVVNRPTMTAQQTGAKKDAPTIKPTVQNPKTDNLVKLPPPQPKVIDTVVQKTDVKPAETAAVKPDEQTVTKPVETAPIKPVETTPIKPAETAVIIPTVKKPSIDTVVKKPVLPKSNSIYTYEPDAPHMAVIIMDKVDPVFVNEAKNAFNRFNKDRYYNQPLESQIISLNNEIKLLLVSGFPTAQAAADYAERTRAIAAREIIPWLTGNKYTFSIISAPNLELLKGTTDFSVYKKFLDQYLPGKF